MALRAGMQPLTPTKGEAAGDEASSTEPLHERPLDISRATSAFHGSIGVEHPSPPAGPPPAHGPSRQKAVAQASGQAPAEEVSPSAPTAPGPGGDADKAPAGSPTPPAPSAATRPTTEGSKGGGSAEGSRGNAGTGDGKGGAAVAPASSPAARAQQAAKASETCRERSSPTRQRLKSPSRWRASHKYVPSGQCLPSLDDCIRLVCCRAPDPPFTRTTQRCHHGRADTGKSMISRSMLMSVQSCCSETRERHSADTGLACRRGGGPIKLFAAAAIAAVVVVVAKQVSAKRT